MKTLKTRSLRSRIRSMEASFEFESETVWRGVVIREVFDVERISESV